MVGWVGGWKEEEKEEEEEEEKTSRLSNRTNNRPQSANQINSGTDLIDQHPLHPDRPAPISTNPNRIRADPHQFPPRFLFTRSLCLNSHGNWRLLSYAN